MTPFGLRRKILLSFISIAGIWLFGFLWFIQQIPQTKAELPDFSTYNSSTVIVVLTGGTGRLEYGLQLLAEHIRGEILFISGVSKNVTITDILQQIPETTRKNINESSIVLGHQAENTIGNAEEIKDWLAKNPAQNIVLVTSNYHMPRSLLELNSALPDISIIPAPVIANDNSLLLSEYHKYIASKLRHLFVSVTNNK